MARTAPGTPEHCRSGAAGPDARHPPRGSACFATDQRDTLDALAPRTWWTRGAIGGTPGTIERAEPGTATGGCGTATLGSARRPGVRRVALPADEITPAALLRRAGRRARARQPPALGRAPGTTWARGTRRTPDNHGAFASRRQRTDQVRRHGSVPAPHGRGCCAARVTWYGCCPDCCSPRPYHADRPATAGNVMVVPGLDDAGGNPSGPAAPVPAAIGCGPLSPADSAPGNAERSGRPLATVP